MQTEVIEVLLDNFPHYQVHGEWNSGTPPPLARMRQALEAIKRSDDLETAVSIAYHALDEVGDG